MELKCMNYLTHHFKVLKDYLFLLMILQMVMMQAWKTNFLPKAKIKNYNILLDGRNFYDQPINDLIKQYDEVRQISTGQDDDYTTGLSMNSVRLHLHAPTHASIYLDVLLSHVQNLITHQHFSKCFQLSFCKKFICNFMLSWVSIRRNPLYYVVFGSKHTSVGDAQKHFKLV